MRRSFQGFTVSGAGARLKVADNAIDKLKARVRELTRRTRGHRLADVIAELREALLGWKAYFGFAEVTAHGPWRISKTPALTLALPLRTFQLMGLPDLAA